MPFSAVGSKRRKRREPHLMIEDAAAEGDAGELHGQSGQALEGARRLTYRQARPWLRRSDAVNGLRPCGIEVHWVADDERQALVERLRHAEGKDCNVAGDVLLYRLGGGNVIVVEEPY